MQRHEAGIFAGVFEWLCGAKARVLVLLFCLGGLSPALRAAEAWKVGDKVEAWNSAWYPAEVLEVGAGEHAGYFRVHYDNFSAASDQWINAKNLRARPGAKQEAAKKRELAAGPRLGKYLVYSYGAPPNRIYLGDIELLSGGRYRASQPGGKALGDGKYAFDADQKAVVWLSGPYQKPEWGGAFEVSREGKTHTIRLRRGTVATNSTD